MLNRSLADQYADIDFQIKALEDQKKALKAQIVELGTELVAGDNYDVKVSLSQRSVLDFSKMESTYGINEATFKLYSACTKDGACFEVLKVVAKETK